MNGNNRRALLYKAGWKVCLEWKVCGRISDRCIENQENVKKVLLLLREKTKTNAIREQYLALLQMMFT